MDDTRRALLGLFLSLLPHPLPSLRRIALSGISHLSLSDSNERMMREIEEEVVGVARKGLIAPARDQAAR